MLLAMDTSTAQTGLALYDGAQVVAECTWRVRGHHSRELAPALTALLERSAVTVDSLQAIGVATGPGSFTSLRVGLALAKGLALARGLRLIGVPTLDVSAAAIPPVGRTLIAVLQAGRGRLAVGRYQAEGDGWRAIAPPQAMTVEALIASIQEEAILCGELSAEERAQLGQVEGLLLASPAQCVRRPALLAELAWQRWQAGQTDSLAALAPLYLHVSGGPA
jgi:tRNA threonylcarbamoyladenosine biosynthesis protein TsaB